MTLKDFFELCKPKQKVNITRDNGYVYEGTVSECPAYMLGDEVTKTGTFCDEMTIRTKMPQYHSMTWAQLLDAIRSMPEWALDMPAMIYIEEGTVPSPDENYGIDAIVNYYGESPSEIHDDGMDFVFMVLGNMIY